MVAEGVADCLRLGPIPKLGGCGVGIQVLDCRGSEPSILQSEFHHPANSSAPSGEGAPYRILLASKFAKLGTVLNGRGCLKYNIVKASYPRVRLVARVEMARNAQHPWVR
jgi:hypothetical protein